MTGWSCGIPNESMAMDDHEPAAAIDAAAARWVARLDRAHGDPALMAQLETWLGSDPRRRGALLRAQACWAALDAHAPAASSTRALLSRRGLIAAGGVAAVALGGITWTALTRDETIATVAGERRAVQLADGSTVLLNTATRSTVALTDTRRSVVIERGEAWFAVAKDKARPFVVAAGPIRVEAVGTAFAVRRFADRADVIVTEGRVRIWSVAAPARFLLLEAGRRATIDDKAGAADAKVSAGGIADALAWRSGEIVLDGMTLGDAAAEFNRYNRRQLAVEAALSERRLVGRFRTGEVDSFAASAAAMTGGRIERDGDIVRIVE